MILVTGGLGFIGSHTVVELIKSNYEVVIADNLANSKISVLESLEKITNKKIKFYQVDVTTSETEKIFAENQIEAIIHFAGFKAVGESVSKPLEYYYNNLLSTINLAKLAVKYHVKHFVFSSSATIYGDQKSPLNETLDYGKTTNPYGETKVISERILIDTKNANQELTVTILRYFNPIGAHESGLIGENPNGIPNNLLPFINKVAKGTLDHLNVFGNDYDTIDGTGVRDYIHVVDLAKGHVLALKNNNQKTNIYNLGTGKGYSVLEIVRAFEKVNKIKIPYIITSRRPGDIATSYADPAKAKLELGFETIYTLDDMVRSGWNFEVNNQD